MTTPAIERLRKILALEEKQAFRNRAVVGGLPAMCDRWAADAEKESADSGIVTAIVRLLKQYPSLNKESRPKCVETMREVLDGNLGGVASWVDSDDLEQDDKSERVEFEDDAVDVDSSDPIDDDFSAVDEIPEGTPRGEESVAELDESDEDELEEDADESESDRSSRRVKPAGPTDQAEKEVSKKRKSSVKRSPHELQSSVELLNGVGPAMSETLAKIGINQIIDFFWHLPTRYDDYSQMASIAELEPGEQVTVIANLWEIRERKVGMNRQMVQGILADGSGTLHATWWNKYVLQKLTTGSTMRFSGKVGLYMGQKTLDNPSFEELDTDMVETGRLTPVYRLTEGLSSKRLRSLIKTVLDEFSQFISDPLPPKICQKYSLPALAYSLQEVHFPSTNEKMEEARRRLVFEELLYIQLGIQRRRHEVMLQATATALDASSETLDVFRQSLPFPLTGAQERVVDEIMRDLARTVPMTRLVQGDVGSGKTAVAAAAMYVAAANGVQSAMLAPTQILAEQHYRGISSLLENLTRPDGSPLRVALLTGRVGGAERVDIQNGLRLGEIDILVGTTAIIQEHIQFQNLGLAIVDEQHRFGVEQRGALRRGDHRPHLLVMSATPIPRSLALTIYGDLDISVIDEMPPGRTPVKTKWFMPEERERVYGFLKREVREGRQGFIVYPLVEESEKLDAGSAVAEFERLSSEIFPNERLALLHGRMSGSEKDEVMTAFANGDYDILVSTTVIEVGIDVPNASLIIIEDADRFGLAQLHQLRGRVGRGQHASYCALVSKGKSANAEERLVALQESNDGFVLAQKDLDMRGPGDFFGTQQSGLPDLRVAHLSDVELVALSQEAAKELLADDPTLEAYPQLAQQIDRFWRGHGDIN